jgi:hypothetical protein
MTRLVKNIIIQMAVISLVALAGQSSAANVNERPFEFQVAEADFVVVAKMLDTGPGQRRFDSTGLMQLTRMKTLRVLKGNHDITAFDFVIHDEVAELDPGCCEQDKVYILVLRRGSNQNIFAAVNGRYSVIPVP